MSIEKWRSDVIAVAEKQVGISEMPFGSNRQKYGEWYGLNGVSWCAIWVSWVFARSGHPLPRLQSDKGFSGVVLGFKAAQKVGLTVLNTDGQPGDIFCHNSGGGKGHTGIIVKVNKIGDTVVSYDTIEGNSNANGSRTGGSVVKYQRSVSYINLGIIRPFVSKVVVAPKPVEVKPVEVVPPAQKPPAPKPVPVPVPSYPTVGGIVKMADKKYYLVSKIVVSLLPVESVAEVMKIEGPIWVPSASVAEKIEIVGG
jgi:hypothetical protein